MTDFEQLMLFPSEEVFKASWKDKNYKNLKIEIDRVPVPKQGDRSKVMPRGKGLSKQIGHEHYYRLKDLYVLHYQNQDLVTEVEAVKWLLKSQLPGHKVFEEEIIITSIDFVFPVLKSFSAKKIVQIQEGAIIHKTSKPDLDNLQKLFFDCCTDIIWKDDAKISWTNNIRKRYGIKGQTIVELYGR